MTVSSAVTEQEIPKGARPTAQILPFPRPALQAAGNRLTLRDRLDLAAWEAVAFAHGFTRMAIDTSASDGCDDLGDYVSLYRNHSGWASWCVGCARGGFTVWRMDGRDRVHWFPALGPALRSVLAAEPGLVALAATT